MNADELRAELMKEWAKQFENDPFGQMFHQDFMKREAEKHARESGAFAKAPDGWNPVTPTGPKPEVQDPRFDPHFSEQSSRKLFVQLLNDICARLRSKGLYVKLVTQEESGAIIAVSHDSPGARDQMFKVKRHDDNKTYSWDRISNYSNRGFSGYY